MKFRKYLLENSQINKNNWKFLENFMKKQPGFISFDIIDNELVIKFKKNIQAINAQKKSNQSNTEISAFGQSSVGDSEIRVELNKDAIQGINEMNEGVDLSKYKSKVAKWIDDNDNVEVRALMAKLVGDKRLIKVVDGINAIVDYETHNPIPKYTQDIYTLLNDMGRKKYGKDNWDSNIYNP